MTLSQEGGQNITLRDRKTNLQMLPQVHPEPFKQDPNNTMKRTQDESKLAALGSHWESLMRARFS